MTAANSCNIPSIGPISNTSTGTFSSSYNKFYQPGWANIGIGFSGTTFTISSESGTAFSSTNPGFVALQSLANPGQIKRFSVIANQTFTQAGLGNNLFGVTTAVNWATDMPFYLYAVSNANNGENAIAFMISRIPHRTVAPVAGKIAQSGNTNATTQGSFYSLATITAADYASAPCLCLGSFRMQYASSLWTVQTLNNSDGIGQYNDGFNIFTFPPSQMGAATGARFAANGGTAPIWTTETATYTIRRNGYVEYIFTSNSGTYSQNGVGAVTLKPIIPLNYGLSSTNGLVATFINNTGVANSLTFAFNPATAISTLTSVGLYGQNGNGQSILNQDCAPSASLGINFGYIADIG